MEMLRFVLGRNSSDKTSYVRQEIANRIRAGEKDFILLVPEQFSFDTEREMLRMVGAKNMLSLEIFSFSRLAETVLAQTEPTSKPKIDDGTRAILMSRAIEGLKDKTPLYNKFINKPNLLKSLITFSTELKQCNISSLDLQKAEGQLQPSVLKEKLSQLNQITDLYRVLVEEQFSDDTNLLDSLANVIPKTEYFNGKTILLDAFDGFTKQERTIIRLLLSRAKDVYITFCLDKDIVKQVPCVFDNIFTEMNQIKQLAAQEGIPVAKPVYLPNSRMKKAKALSVLEENMYKINPEQCTDESVPVEIFCAKNPADECDFVACQIHKILRTTSYRAKDIVVIERRKDAYDADLHAAFQKYQLPFFEDKRQPVCQQPLMQYCSALLSIASDGFQTETLMRYLKTGLTAFCDKKIAQLEAYATVWDIDGTKWLRPFTENPEGLGVEFHDKAIKKLQQLNTLRENFTEPLLVFRKRFKDGNGAEKSNVFYDFLMQNAVDKHLKLFAQRLQTNGFSELAQQQNEVWSTLMRFLDSLSAALGAEEITSKRYQELFAVLLDSVDLGQIPQGLDRITIGAIDRIRISPPKVVFIVGANDGVFPENPPTEGILNDAERKTLEKIGLVLTETAEFKTIDERSFVYNALSMPTDALYISYSMSDFMGNGLTESSLVKQVQKILPQAKVTDSNVFPLSERAECFDASFEAMALLYHDSSVLSETLKAFFREKPAYANRLEALSYAVDAKPKQFTSAQKAEELFGKDMLISASKAEGYYKCPFSYFCKYGLYLKPVKKAEIDFAQGGTVMHYVLENLLREYSISMLSTLSDAALQEEIMAWISRYIQEKMGGEADKDERFLYLLSSLSKTLFEVVKRLIEEEKVCTFVPTDFELSIRPDGTIAPYKLQLPNGGSISIVGSVDRVDTMKKDGKTYFRVVDYKSGGKTFRLTDVLKGLNMQMLIYLYAIAENGTDRYDSAIPAGVLYFPATTVLDKLSRNAKPEDVLTAKLKGGRMNGVVLNQTDVILGMDKDVTEAFIPVKRGKDEFQGNLLNTNEFDRLRNCVDQNLLDMASNLQKGEIPVRPTYINTDNIACQYCEYRTICGFEEGDTIRTVYSSDSFAKGKAEFLKQAQEE